MTISEKEVDDILKNEDEDIMSNLGFVLTVIRDNTSDDRTYGQLAKLIQRLK